MSMLTSEQWSLLLADKEFQSQVATKALQILIDEDILTELDKKDKDFLRYIYQELYLSLQKER